MRRDSIKGRMDAGARALTDAHEARRGVVAYDDELGGQPPRLAEDTTRIGADVAGIFYRGVCLF